VHGAVAQQRAHPRADTGFAGKGRPRGASGRAAECDLEPATERGTERGVECSTGSCCRARGDCAECGRRRCGRDGGSSKAGGSTLLSASGTSSCNGTKSTPNLTADLLGDWREELILHTTDSSALRIYTTTEVTKRRIYTLMHDPTYRMQVSFEQSSYNQPPHTGFMIGPGMADPPKPDIHVK
jgi:hypothetical protein